MEYAAYTNRTETPVNNYCGTCVLTAQLIYPQLLLNTAYAYIDLVIPGDLPS